MQNHLDIYVPKAFQRYKEFFNPMNFDPCNRPLKIWKSIETPTPKVGIHLGVWGFIPSHFPTFSRAWNVIPELHFWPAPLPTLALVANPRLGLWHKWQQTYLDYFFSKSKVTVIQLAQTNTH
jgi:hypothetical protein